MYQSHFQAGNNLARHLVRLVGERTARESIDNREAVIAAATELLVMATEYKRFLEADDESD